MNISLKIARAELRSLFYSPIAWFLTIIFIFQSGLSYTGQLGEILTRQQLGGNYSMGMGFLTNSIFGFLGLFGEMTRKVFLYLPLLTMGLISRETSSGTIKLLYSSPIKVGQIVWGKFLAMIGYCMILTLILGLYVLTSCWVIQSADLGSMLSGLLGFFLLLCTYAAIGLFMSCLTTYQVVAALCTLVLLAALNYIGTVWQSVEFVKNLTYFLSISGRTDRMIAGLVSSKDVAYFLSITAMFIGFSILRLEGERTTVPVLKKTLRYCLVFFATAAIGYVLSIPRFIVSYDATATKQFTLHPNTRNIIEQLGDPPLEVTTYINLLDQYIWEGLPDVRNRDLDRWEPYLRAKHNVKLKYVYYYDYPGLEQELMSSNPGKSLKQIAENAARSHNLDLGDFKTPEQIRKIIDLRRENNSYVIHLKYKDRSTFLRLYSDQLMFPSETEVSAALKRLLVPLPKIVFVESEFERGRNPLAQRDYGVLTNGLKNRTSLINQGFDTESISLNDQEIPQGITALVIADPKAPFSTTALEKIRRYIDAGGNMLVTGEPGKQDIIGQVTGPLGVQMLKGQLMQDDRLLPGSSNPQLQQGPSQGTVGVVGGHPGSSATNGQTPDLVKVFLTRDALGKSRYFDKPFRDSIIVSMKTAGALSYGENPDFDAFPLLVTDTRSTWLKPGRFVADSGTVTFSPKEGDIKKAFPTMVALTRKKNGKDQKIVIAGNADFLSNDGLYRPININQANSQIGIGLFSWFSNGQFPVDTAHLGMLDNRLILSSAALKALKIAFMGILPGVFLVLGAVFLFRRKRR